MSVSVTPDQIALAMKNHVINKKTANDEIVDVMVKTKQPKKPSVKNKHIPGVKNQKCKFCNGFFEKVNLHSPYCYSNPNRRHGNRFAGKSNNFAQNHSSIDDKIKDLSVQLFEGKSAKYIMENLAKFNVWMALTREILESN